MCKTTDSYDTDTSYLSLKHLNRYHPSFLPHSHSSNTRPTTQSSPLHSAVLTVVPQPTKATKPHPTKAHRTKAHPTKAHPTKAHPTKPHHIPPTRLDSTQLNSTQLDAESRIQHVLNMLNFNGRVTKNRLRMVGSGLTSRWMGG
jgi:hypothetical protein